MVVPWFEPVCVHLLVQRETVEAEIIVTTLKDLVKLPLASVRNRPICALEIGIQIQSGLHELEYLLEKIL